MHRKTPRLLKIRVEDYMKGENRGVNMWGQSCSQAFCKPAVKAKGKLKFGSKTTSQSRRGGTIQIKDWVPIRCSSRAAPLPRKL